MKAFEKHIKDKVEPKHEFPDLMKLFIEKYPAEVQKGKKSSDGVCYEGIRLKSKKISFISNYNSKTFFFINSKLLFTLNFKL